MFLGRRLSKFSKAAKVKAFDVMQRPCKVLMDNILRLLVKKLKNITKQFNFEQSKKLKSFSNMICYLLIEAITGSNCVLMKPFLCVIVFSTCSEAHNFSSLRWEQRDFEAHQDLPTCRNMLCCMLMLVKHEICEIKAPFKSTETRFLVSSQKLQLCWTFLLAWALKTSWTRKR